MGTAVGTEGAGGDTRSYAAFVSYSHADDEIATWLHRRLEGYRIPKGIAAARGDRGIGKLFRDRVELASSHDLGGDIRKALDQSDALILLCSPRSAKSPYVAEEIRRFKETGKGERIFAVIVDGEPHAAGKPGRRADEECFPRGLLYRVGADGEFTEELEAKEPIAADIRPGKDGRENGALKIIAGLLGSGLDDLVQREKRAERARRLRANAIAAGMSVLALGAVAGGGFAWWLQGEAEKRRAEAELQEASARQRLSDLVAQESNSIATKGHIETAMLMALYADPEAKRSEAGQKFFPEGYDRARASLASATMSSLVSTVLVDGKSPIFGASFSSDGTRILTASEDGTVRIWDKLSGKVTRTLKHEGRVGRAVFSRDGSHIAALSGTRVLVWNLDSAAQAPALNLQHNSGISDVTFSPDGSMIVTASNEGVRVWNASIGSPLLKLVEARATVATFSPDGANLLTSSEDGVMHLWSWPAGRKVREFRGHARSLESAAFSGDGSKIISLSRDYSVRLWDASQAQTLQLWELRTPAVSVAISPDGTRVAMGLNDSSIHIFDAATRNEFQPLKGHTDLLFALSFSPDGSQLLSASTEGAARLWNIRPQEPLVRSLGGEEEAIASYSPDGAFVLAVAASGQHLLDAATLQPVIALDDEAFKTTVAVFSPDSSRLMTASFTQIRLWDLKSKSVVWALDESDGGAYTAAFSPDGSRIVVPKLDIERGEHEQVLRVRDAATGTQILTLQQQYWGTDFVRFSPDGTRILAGDDMGTVMWDAKTGAELWRTQNPWVNFGTFSRDGARVLTVSEDERLLLVSDAATGEIKVRINVGGDRREPIVAVLSPDGKQVLSSLAGKVARIWDANTGAPLVTFAANLPRTRAGDFSPDGSLVATGSDRLEISDASSGTILMAPSQELIDSPGSTEFSPDGAHVLVGGRNGVLRIDVPEIARASAARQVEIACHVLWKANAPLAFSVEEIQQYPVLTGEPVDFSNSEMLRSPCEGVLPDQAFAKPAGAGSSP